MKKKSMTFAATVIGLAMLMSACTQKQKLPQNPKDKEEYKDEEGNRWVYNSHGNFWMVYALMNSMNSSNASSGYATTPNYQCYRYYPSNNSWTNATGSAKATPSSSLTNFASGSYRSANTSTRSSVNTGTSKSSSGKSFSVSRSSHSIGA